MEAFGKAKEEWLKTFLRLPGGIPSHDTFNRVFSALEPEELEKSFIAWTQAVVRLAEGEVVAIDGKSMRGTREAGNKSIVHMVSAWAQENHIALGQVKVDEKSNEITAIPRLLDLLVLKGCIVTIDAMGCQRDISAKIVDKEAHYILALKGNQEYRELDGKRYRIPDSYYTYFEGGYSVLRWEETSKNILGWADRWVKVDHFFIENGQLQNIYYSADDGETWSVWEKIETRYAYAGNVKTSGDDPTPNESPELSDGAKVYGISGAIVVNTGNKAQVCIYDATGRVIKKTARI
jgi:hypothetical protein